MPKISELNSITSLYDTDLLAVAHDIDGSPSTRKITVGNFANSLVDQVASKVPTANTTTAGVVIIGDNISVDENGVISAAAGSGSSLPTTNQNEGYILTWDDAVGEAQWQPVSPVYGLSTIDNSGSYIVEKHDGIILVDPGTAEGDITIVLPISEAVTGKQYIIKNVYRYTDFKATITTTDGRDYGTPLVEDVATHNLVVYYDMYGDQGITFVFDGTKWRSVAISSNLPNFITSLDSYAQVTVQNRSPDYRASSDLALYNDAGSVDAGTGPFVDIGINSSVYSDTTYGDVWGANDSYVYNYGGNLIVGPQTDHTIKLVTGNTNTDSIRLLVNSHFITVNSHVITANASLVDLQAYTDNTNDSNHVVIGSDYVDIYAYNASGIESWADLYLDNSDHAAPAAYITLKANTGSAKSWSFAYNSQITLPEGGVISEVNFLPGITIKPAAGYNNTLGIVPTGDGDIRLYESYNNSAVTLGTYGQTNFRVYGPAGDINSGLYANDIRAELVQNSIFYVTTYDTIPHEWMFKPDGNLTLPANGDIINSDGYSVIKSIPQNLQSGSFDYTLQLSDSGQHIYKSDGEGFGVAVPANADVAFPIGSVITIVSGNGWTYIYPSDGGSTTEIWGAGYNQTSTSFYIPNNSMATLLKIDVDKWMLSGAGLAID